MFQMLPPVTHALGPLTLTDKGALVALGLLGILMVWTAVRIAVEKR